MMSIALESLRDQPIVTASSITLVLLGEGRLAEALMRALNAEPGIAIQRRSSLADLEAIEDSDSINLAVAISTRWQPASDREVQQWCWERHIALLRVSIWQHEAVIGPLVQPGVPGCVECAERRRFRTFILEAENEMRFLTWCEDPAHLTGFPDNPWLTEAALNVVSALAAAEVRAFAARNGRTGTVRFVRLRSLTNSCHMFLPDPTCPICAEPVADRAEDAVIHFNPRPRTNPDSYRSRLLADELEKLEARYIDPRLGLQIVPPAGIRVSAAAFATTLTHYFEYPYILQKIACAGFAHSFRASRATAIVEALERYSGFLLRGKRAMVYGSYRQLREQALDPEGLGLYSPEQYARHSQRPRPYHCVQYHPDLPFHWVWGYSLQQERPVLVPEQIAYYGAAAVRPDGEQFLSETSNGCAVGGSLEEATLYGLFEALERDAFLLAWYGRLKLPAIDLHSTRDTSLRLAIEREERMTGFTFHAFDCTTDFGLPVVLAAGINRVNEAPRLIYGAAAHWDPDRALANAFYEAAAGIVGQRVRFPQELERGEQLVKDDSLVLSIEDHVLAGAMPSAFSRASFLFQDQPLQSMSERFASQYAEAPTADLTEILSRLARRIIARGYDIVIINQTAPELRASDLYCVRVLVPGLMPMTFGHDFRRIYGLERLYRLPQELGYTERILSEADLNPYPHAFP